MNIESIVASILIGGLFFLPTGIPLASYYLSEASKRVANKDTLRNYLKLSNITEVNGVQFCVIPYPDEVTTPSYIVISVIMQNCHTTPRSFFLTLQNVPCKTEDNGVYSVRLEGGESGILNILGLVDNTKPGEHAITYKIKIKKMSTVGKRMINRDGVVHSIVGGKKYALITVSDVKSIEPEYSGLQTYKGYHVIYKPSMNVVNLKPIAFLNVTT